MAVYSATKYTVVGLTMAVRDEFLGTGIGLTVAMPTFINTEMATGLNLRGLPVRTPTPFARAIVRAACADRPPAAVTIPRWLGPLHLLLGLVPRTDR